MKDSEALIAARALIAKPENWAKGSFWKKNGGACHREEATQFCAIGAMFSANNLSSFDWHDRIGFQYLRDAAFPQSLAEYNDTRTHAEVIGLYDRAIKNALRAERASIGWRRFLPWQK